jgi:hypothetical protein
MMASPLLFMAGTVVRRDMAFIAAQIVELNRRDVEHTKVLRWKDGAWAHYMIDWPVTRVLSEQAASVTVYAAEPFGRVHIARGRERVVEHVDQSREGPANRGVIRHMQWIGGMIHAVGMQRQAYRRTAAGVWEHFDEGAALSLGSREIKSFDSIDGFSTRDIYAAGLDGEIWRYDGVWRQVDSPTSVGLEKVLCVQPQTVYIGGQIGTLLRGRENEWAVIDAGDLRETISDLAWFRGRLYACSKSGLFVVDGDELVGVDLGLGDGWTFGNLEAGDGVLWSIGRTRLAKTIDGVTWEEIVCTDASY